MAIDETARDVLACVCNRFETEERAFCECYAVVGSPVVGPQQCCECETGKTGVAIAQVTQIYDADPQTLAQVTRVYPCKGGSTRAMDMTIWLTRCYPTLHEDGLFDIEEIDEAASEIHLDMGILYKALVCCDTHRLKVNRVAIDSDPSGGCATIVGQVTVEVRP